MMHQLATSLVLYGKIQTTVTKAKAVRPLVERLVRKGADNSIATRRDLMKVLQTQGAVNKVLEVLGPRYAQRDGGYTRIIRKGTRQGDNAPMAEISFV